MGPRVGESASDSWRQRAARWAERATESAGRPPGARTGSPRSSHTAGRARVRHRSGAGSSTRACTASCCSTSADAEAARRVTPRPTSRSTPPTTSWPTWNGSASIWRSRGGCSSVGSWGATLAQAYARAHPDRVTEVVLFSVTAGSRREVDWITEDMRGVTARPERELMSVQGLPRRPGAARADRIGRSWHRRTSDVCAARRSTGHRAPVSRSVCAARRSPSGDVAGTQGMRPTAA
ncbi:MAG: proline iminopeptidase [Actinomycetota bacterium]|jgi:hypothetical protein|nr:proline iminopeptidase [Actinomycetota bacterium]